MPIDDVFLYHKTTRRNVYDEARRQRPDADTVILWNQAGEATEGTEANLVIVSGVCRLFGAEENARLAKRLAGATRPGGMVAILDALPDVDRRDGHRIGLYALSLSLRTSRGGVHPFSSYASWLYDAGFVGIDLTTLPTAELSLIQAVRPS